MPGSFLQEFKNTQNQGQYVFCIAGGSSERFDAKEIEFFGLGTPFLDTVREHDIKQNFYFPIDTLDNSNDDKKSQK